MNERRIAVQWSVTKAKATKLLSATRQEEGVCKITSNMIANIRRFLAPVSYHTDNFGLIIKLTRA